MNLEFILLVVYFILIIISFYAIFKNIDVIKIILNYWKDLLFRK